MRRKRFSRSSMIALLLLAFATASRAQVPVEGISDETVYADSVSFRIPIEPGYEYTAALDGEAVPAGEDVRVDEPGYHELSVTRRLLPDGAEETEVLQFIVRASERGNAEWGLSAWVPHPPIPSSSSELQGAALRLTVPANWPRGLALPAVAWVLDGDGARVGVNGELEVDGGTLPSIRILRGVGSRLLPALDESGARTWTFRSGSLEAARDVTIEETTTWTDVSGTVSGDWGAGARVRVTGDLLISVGTSLRIGAGSVVRLDPEVEVRVDGELIVEGSESAPVVFTPRSPEEPWGGFVLRGAGAMAELTWTILTGSGADPDWFDNTPDSGSSHRDEQSLIFLADGARAVLTDCALIDLHGQAGHGEDAFLTLRRSLVQRAITVGQYNRGTVDIESSALVEFPAVDAPFEDDDNDGLYLTGGAHSIRSSLIGWALDDGIDAGSGSAGSVDVLGCWVESCYHEGLAWSEDRDATVEDTVVLDCGQGIEAGFGSPDVLVSRSLSTGNLTGARFGDNYDWDYDGVLTVADSLLLHNARDVWGRAWDDWTVHLSQMDVRGNLLTAADPLFPENAVWDPESDAARLEPFLPAAPGPVGVAIATSSERFDAVGTVVVPVRLSSFSPATVSVAYTIEVDGDPAGGGELLFAAGDTVETIVLEEATLGGGIARVSIADPVSAEITGLAEVLVARTVTLIAAGAVWRYLDGDIDPGPAWPAPAFDDSSWEEGPAELGFGDDDEATVIDGGPDGDRYPTVYFRRRFDVPDPLDYESLVVNLRRDDGGAVYLNGVEVFRSNLPDGELTHETFASDTTSSEDGFFSMEIDASGLLPGENVVAVEVHQANAGSSDLSFALELLARPRVARDGAFVRADVNEDGSVDISDPVGILLHLFGGHESSCDDAFDADDTGAVNVTDAIYLLEFLFREGPVVPAPFPGPGTDPTADDLDCAGS